MNRCILLVPLLFLTACEKNHEVKQISNPSLDTQKPSKTKTARPPVLASKDTSIPLVIPEAPKSTDPVWNKILEGGLTSQKFRPLRDRVGELVSEGRSPEAWIAVNSLPLGNIRDNLASEFFSTVPLVYLKQVLSREIPLSVDDELTLSHSIVFNTTTDAPVDYVALAEITKNQTVKEDFLARACLKIKTSEQWEALASKGLSEKGLITAANSAFSKLRGSEPEYLKNLSSNQGVGEGIRNEAAKAYALLLFERSPQQSVNFISDVGSIPAADYVYQTWLKQDPETATSWMKTQKGTKFYRTLVMRTIGYAEANHENETANAWRQEWLSLPEPE